MVRIELDAQKWKSVLDFYEDFLRSLGAPPWHGEGIDALIDSIGYRDINQIEAPFVVHVVGLDKSTDAVRNELRLVREYVGAKFGVTWEIDGGI